ncbi:MAG: CvpA family protein [Calditrichaeota bacterium]|nr:CvpA family protein [Calditrichota bacterium]
MLFPVALLDIIIFAIIVVFVVAGAKRGLVWELFTLAGFGLGLWIPYTFRSSIADFIARYTDSGQTRLVVTILAFLVVFSAIYITFSHIGSLLHKILEKILLGWLDRLLGALLGLVKGVVLVGLLVVAVFLSPWHEQGGRLVRESKILSWGKGHVEKFLNREPPNLRRRV